MTPLLLDDAPCQATEDEDSNFDAACHWQATEDEDLESDTTYQATEDEDYYFNLVTFEVK